MSDVAAAIMDAAERRIRLNQKGILRLEQFRRRQNNPSLYGIPNTTPEQSFSTK